MPYRIMDLGLCCMMTSSNGNIFRITGPLCREFPGHRWIPLTKASDTGLVFFRLCLKKRLSKNRKAGDWRRHHAHYDVIVVASVYDVLIDGTNLSINQYEVNCLNFSQIMLKLYW